MNEQADLALRERVGRELLGWRAGRAPMRGWVLIAPNGDEYEGDWQSAPPWELSLDAAVRDMGTRLEALGWRWRIESFAEHDARRIEIWHPEPAEFDTRRRVSFCPRGHEARTLCELALQVGEEGDDR